MLCSVKQLPGDSRSVKWSRPAKNVFSRLFDDDDDDDDGNGLRRLMNYRKNEILFSLVFFAFAKQQFLSHILLVAVCADLKKELMILFSVFVFPAQTITDRE